MTPVVVYSCYRLLDVGYERPLGWGGVRWGALFGIALGALQAGLLQLTTVDAACEAATNANLGGMESATETT